MEEQVVINKTEKPSSYEFGKVGNRFKIYFSDVPNLQDQLTKLMEADLITAEDFGNTKKE